MRFNNTFWGGVIIVVGLVFLLDALNIIAINAWGIIWSVALIIVGIWFLSWALGDRRAGETEDVAIPLEGAENARVVVRHGAGRLSIEGGAESGELLSGTASGGIEFRKRIKNGKLRVDVQAPGRIYNVLPFTKPLIWDLKISEEIPLELDVRGGANETNLDLSNLNVTNLNLRTGASETIVTMPAKVKHTRAEAHCSVASVRINIPEGVAARIRSSGGLSNVSIDRDRFPRSGGAYQSPDYDTAECKLELYLSMGIGSLIVR
jgi:hypothetical protein